MLSFFMLLRWDLLHYTELCPHNTTSLWYTDPLLICIYRNLLYFQRYYYFCFVFILIPSLPSHFYFSIISDYSCSLHILFSHLHERYLVIYMAWKWSRDSSVGIATTVRDGLMNKGSTYGSDINISRSITPRPLLGPTHLPRKLFPQG
jgi:hypothetical protein